MSFIDDSEVTYVMKLSKLDFGDYMLTVSLAYSSPSLLTMWLRRDTDLEAWLKHLSRMIGMELHNEIADFVASSRLLNAATPTT